MSVSRPNPNRTSPAVLTTLLLALLLAWSPALAQDEPANGEADDPAAPPAVQQPEGEAEAQPEAELAPEPEPQDEAEPDQPQPAPGEPLEIIVEAVQGMVQVRQDEEGEWQRAEPGMALAIGAEVRTGPRSIVRLQVGATQTITLDRLGTVQVLEAIKREGVINTDIGMPYGRTRYQVQSVEDVEHSGQIRSPSASLAVTGSEGLLEDYADRPPLGGSDSGTIAFINTDGRFIPLDPPSRIEGDQTAGAQYQLADGTFNPLGLSLSELEQWLMGQYPSGTFQHWLADFHEFRDHDSANASFDYFAENFGEGGETFPGALSFEVIGPLDLDFPDRMTTLQVTDPFGETLSLDDPLNDNFASSDSGGNMSFFANDGEYQWFVVWPEGVPYGTYTAELWNDTNQFLSADSYDVIVRDSGNQVIYTGSGGLEPPPYSEGSERIIIEIPLLD
ncbi:MAG: hypothetical protein WD294_05755 [Phycisphaeraceae bacterium]